LCGDDFHDGNQSPPDFPASGRPMLRTGTRKQEDCEDMTCLLNMSSSLQNPFEISKLTGVGSKVTYHENY
jgi:hypothetical protein